MFTPILYILILVHTPDNQLIGVNPNEIVSIREPKTHEGHFPKNTRCIINTVDGKLTLTTEDCKTIREMLSKG